MNNRADLDSLLQALDQRLNDLLAEHGSGQVLAAFSEEASVVMNGVHADDTTYVYQRISCMLSGAGLIPGQDEGEQCRIGD